MSVWRVLLVALCAWPLAAAPPARAAESAPFTDARGTATLVSDRDSVAAGGAVRVALRLALAPGWHTYGRDPGDAGEPPDLEWTLPAGVTAGPIAWPPALRMEEGGVVTYGYTGTVLLPTDLSGASAPLDVGLHARWLVCSTICVPEEARLTLHLPAGNGAPGPQAPLFAASASGPMPPALPGGGPGVPLALLLALAGGAILNLMPCVFPVLAIKAAGLARLAAAGRAAVLGHAAAYAAGTVLSFVAVGGGLLVLRAGGQAAGWGFQFASPGFVAATLLVLFAVGLNLSGVFEADIPGLAGAGDGLTRRAGWVGSFATGALAVLAATPCTVPFMGAALAVALAAPAAVALAIFAVLGAGLALPYLLLAAVPALVRALPRPGAWMATFRQVLAFPMYGACAWLLWVLAQEAGSDGVLAAAGGACLLAFAGWALGRLQRAPRGRAGWRLTVVAALAVLLLLGGPFLANLSSVGAPARLAAADGEPFSEARLDSLRAEGRPVFVDMTAAWCVTCLVNERVALDRAPVRAAFAARRVAVLRGDWTRQDPALTGFLRRHGHEGVPLYLFYPPGGGQPVLLPQILTEGTVLGLFQGTAG